MYERFISCMKSIGSTYKEITSVGNQVHMLLIEKKVKDMQPLQMQVMKLLEELQQKEAEIASLLPSGSVEEVMLTSSEREYVEALVAEIRREEQNARQVLKRNQYALQLQISITENIVDCISDMHMEQHHNSQLFVNELL
ncbi:flagellar protein FlgN [Ectobacillus sp. JY-23]|uniref:flagellar protein FlgN n=1 Tax=Ectobacillus sp. JY-23 TaxID=2933872 RepID=UPI001FF56ACF|nr:flagellar protein FlgN [Ectobacillus sp. JY-23]UOY93394.1 flagellar protein FlgN [Ectobacillus sp. JY-23]